MTTDKTHLLKAFSNTVSRAQKKTTIRWICWGKKKKIDGYVEKNARNPNCARMLQPGTLSLIPHLGFKIII